MKYSKKVKPNWNNIFIIQDKLGLKLRKHEKGYIDSIKMVAGELLENSVKYYMKKGIKKSIEFHFSDKDGVIISIHNQLIEPDDARIVTKLIDRINSSINPYTLFIDRLQEILDNRIKGESRLGLLRVASDGGYILGYKQHGDRFNIYAKKSKIGEEPQMKSLIYEDLTIEVTEKDSHVNVSWIGKCRTLNPENILDTYLAQVSQFVKGKKVIVTFDRLDSMNSSTVPPLLTFIKTLEENSVESVFLYDDREDWQRASFKPLSVIAGRYKNIVIKAISSHENV